MAVSMLEFGMFVTELDRPWVDTPFLLQGFLIDSQAELDSLRQFCSHVYIDLKFSDEAVAANCLDGRLCCKRADGHQASRLRGRANREGGDRNARVFQ